MYRIRNFEISQGGWGGGGQVPLLTVSWTPMSILHFSCIVIGKTLWHSAVKIRGLIVFKKCTTIKPTIWCEEYAELGSCDCCMMVDAAEVGNNKLWMSWCDNTEETWRIKSWLIWLTLTVKTSRQEFGSIDMEPDDIDFVGDAVPPPPINFLRNIFKFVCKIFKIKQRGFK